MKILFFIDKSDSKILVSSNEHRLTMLDPFVDNSFQHLVHALNPERSSKYLSLLKDGTYASLLEPGTNMENVKIVEVDFINGTVKELQDFVQTEMVQNEHKECSNKSCGSCTDASKSSVTNQKLRTTKQTKTNTTKQTKTNTTKETKMAKAKTTTTKPKAKATATAPKKAPKKGAKKAH